MAGEWRVQQALCVSWTIVFQHTSKLLTLSLVLATLIVVNVVQHCSGLNVSKIGYLGKLFARAAYGGAWNLRKKTTQIIILIYVSWSSERWCQAQDQPYWSQIGQIRVFAGPGGFQAA